MKKKLLWIFILCAQALSAQQILDIGIFNNPLASNKLELRIKPTQTVTNGAYTAGVFTVRFLSSYGVTLTAPAALNNPLFRYALANQGTDGTYSYYSFSFVSPFTVNWNIGTEYPIAVIQINAGCGSGNGVFEIINNAWTAANNGNVYQELNGTEAQNIIYQPTTTAPLGVGMIDTTPPTITCPTNKIAATNFNQCIHTNLGLGWDALGMDNCPGFIIQYILTGATNDTLFTLDDAVFNKGLTTLNVTITDGAGLTDDCSFTVTVNDSLPPVITAPPTVIVPANAAGCTSIGVLPGTPVSSDNCPGSMVTNNAPASFPKGNTTVVWTVTDAAGWTATATQTVTVQSSLAANAINLSSHAICVPDTVNLSFTLSGGLGSYTIVYTANGIQNTATGYASNQLIPISPLVTTGYQLVSVTDSIGCVVLPPAMVDTLIALPNPTLSSLAVSDSSICQGDSVVFTANGLLPGVSTTFNFTLTPGSPGSLTGTSSPTGTFTFPQAANPPGVYVMSIQSITVNGCTVNFSTGNSGTYSVQANPTLSSLQVSAALVCQGDSVSFTANGLIPNQTTTFQYTLQPGGPASQTGTSSASGTFTFSAASNQPGMVSMTLQSITVNGCTTSFNTGNTASYTVKPAPTLSSLQASATAVCLGDPVSFTANGLIPNESTTFQYTWTPGGPAMQTLLSSAAGTVTFPPATNPPGMYGMSIQSITVNGCSATFSTGNSATYTVSAFPTLSSISASASVVCSGTPVHFMANGLPPDVSATFFYTINGVPGNVTVFTNSTGTALLLSAIYPEGSYTVTITAVMVAGCSTLSNVSTMFTVDPFQAMCGFTVAGRLATELGKNVEEVSVTIAGTSNSAPFNFTDFTDTTGIFSFVNMIPQASNYVITPFKNDNPLNGVTTYDLVLISKHILGSGPLNSVYKMIAADANKSGSVTSFDIVELRKLILGIYMDLPNNTSWRFIDKYYVFPDTNNPFVPQFPVTVTETNLQMSALNEDFVAVKVGDVNGTVVLGFSAAAEDRTQRETLWFDIKASGIKNTRSVQAGETFSLSFSPAEKHAGYQFTLDLKDLELLDIRTSEGLGIENFGVFQDAITCSYAPEHPDQTGAFILTFRASASGELSRMLAISSRITPAEAYNTDQEMLKMNVNGRFVGINTQHLGFELFQNQPNPFSINTLIPFYLPAADWVRITLFDELGSVVYSRQDRFESGQNSFDLDGNLFAGSGLLFYKVESSTSAAVRKMMRK